MKMLNVEIPFDVADKIVVATLKEQLNYLLDDLKLADAGKWMHPEDYSMTKNVYIPALKTVILYFGGDDE